MAKQQLDKIVEDVFSALKLISPCRGDLIAESVYPVMIGAGVSLLQFHKLANSGRSPGWHLYDIDRLYEDLRAAFMGPGLVRWDKGQNFHDWSAGFFVNRAEHNIAAAFDILLTAYVAHRWNLRKNMVRMENLWIGTWPPSRLYILLQGIREEHRKSFSDLIGAFGGVGDVSDTELARCAVNKAAMHVHRSVGKGLTMNDVYESLSESPKRCVAIVWGRTNRFKHRLSGKELASIAKIGRKTRLIGEFLITVRALSCIGRLFGTMMTEVLESKKPRGKPRRV